MDNICRLFVFGRIDDVQRRQLTLDTGAPWFQHEIEWLEESEYGTVISLFRNIEGMEVVRWSWQTRLVVGRTGWGSTNFNKHWTWNNSHRPDYVTCLTFQILSVPLSHLPEAGLPTSIASVVGSHRTSNHDGGIHEQDPATIPSPDIF
jgi:hypothetical protein